VYCLPERREWRLLTGVIPYACRDQPAAACDTRHLGQSAYRIVHEVHDELRKATHRIRRPGTAAPLLAQRVRQLQDVVLVQRRRIGRWITPATDEAPRRWTSSVVSAPVPQPTSS